MAFCSKCGAQLQDGEKFCSACGAPVETTAQQPEAPKPEAPKADGDISQKVNDLVHSGEDKTSDFTQEDINTNRAMGILAYIICFIPMFAAKDSKFARFHANQGLVILIGIVALSIISSVLGFIPLLGKLISIVAYLGEIGLGVLDVFGLVFAAKGQAKALPIVGKIQILK